MRIVSSAAKYALTRYTRKRFRAFQDSLYDPRGAQRNVLGKIIDLTGNRCLPESPTSYVDYPRDKSWSLETPKFFEPTSGSSGQGCKQIPYTPALQSSFHSLFQIWAFDVLEHGPRFQTGRTFISISPPTNKGMVDDTGYLDTVTGRLMRKFLVSPKSKPKDSHRFFFEVARELAECESLEILSIWSPSYLFSILSLMQSLHQSLQISDFRRQALLDQNFTEFWPQLKFISAWGSASSRNPFKKLDSLFPEAMVQKKGLLSTEAPVTVPLLDFHSGSFPMWLDVYLEILDDQQRIRPLTSIAEGETAEILVSTLGGAKRYRLGDLIVCTQKSQNSPVIEFIGRKGEASDLVGEKIEGIWLRDQLRDLTGDWLLAPLLNSKGQSFYQLFSTETPRLSIESILQRSYHYRLARQQGQLAEAKIKLLPDLTLLKQRFLEREDVKRGDIKDVNLWDCQEKTFQFLKSVSKPDLSFDQLIRPEISPCAPTDPRQSS